MKYIKTFDYVTENAHNPLEGYCGTTIGGKDFEFKVGKLIDFVSKNYTSEIISVDKLKKLSMFENIDKDNKNVRDEKGKVFIKGKWKNEIELSDEEFEKYKQEQYNILMASDLRFPIILTKNKQNKFIGIIDGNHRLRKAILIKKKFIKGYILPEEDILKLSKSDLKKLK